MFEKGKPRHPNSGRRAGTANKKKIAKVADMLADQDINPAKEILALIPDLEPRDAVKAWMDLLSYCQAKPKEDDLDDNPSSDEDLLERFKAISDDVLLKIVRSDEVM